MQDRRSFLTILIVTVLASGGYLGYLYFFAKPDHPQHGGEVAETGGAGHGESGGEHGDTTPEPPAIDREARHAAERRATIRTDDFEAVVSNLNGGLVSFGLLHDRYRGENGAPHEMVTTDREEYFPLRLSLPGVPMPPDAVWDIEQLSERAVVLTWEGGGFRVVRRLEAGRGPYQLWSTLRIENEASVERAVHVEMKTFHYVTRDAESGGLIGSRSPNISHGVCMWGDSEITRMDRDKGKPTPGGSERGHGFGPNVRFVGAENAYFASVLVADGEPAERCRIRVSNRGQPEPVGSLFEVTLVYPRVELAPGASTTLRTLAYVGPKDNDALLAAGHHLSQVVDLGWFSLVARYFVALLRIIHGLLGNWGLAIIVMTLLVRIVMLPLTWKSFQSMAQMRVIKPEIDRVTEQFKDDAQAKGQAIMELYRKRGVNPLGGCFPSLLQMPVWFAFYASLSTNVELYHANFALWYTDLSARDPIFILPLCVGGLMHLQQRLTPAATDPTQAKIMMWMMPIMITVFMLFLPSGLCLYMVTNSTLGMTQQLFIQRQLRQKEAAARARAEAEAEAEAEEDEDEARSGGGRDDEVSISGSVVRRTRPKARVKKRRTKRARP